MSERAHSRGKPKQPEGREPPAQLERLVAGVGERSVTNLCAQVEDCDFDRADLRLDGGDALFDGVGINSVHQEARRGAASAFDRLHELIEAFRVRAPTENGVVPLSGKALPDVAADAGSGTEDQADRFHRGSPPKC